jgi:hypothetical protein
MVRRILHRDYKTFMKSLVQRFLHFSKENQLDHTNTHSSDFRNHKAFVPRDVENT